MELQIIHRLKPEDIRQALGYVDNADNDLVRKVLTGEARFQTEIEALKNDDESSFYRRRDDLVGLLNNFPFNKQISDEEREMLDYGLFKDELEKEKKIHKTVPLRALAGSLIACISVLPAGMVLIDPVYLPATCAGGALLIAGIAEMISGVNYIDNLKKLKTVGHLNTPYYKLEINSERTDNFLYDVSFIRGRGF